MGLSSSLAGLSVFSNSSKNKIEKLLVLMKYFLKFATLKRFRKNNTSIKYILEMTIDQYNFNGKKAIVRVDFNVPLD